MTSKIGIVGLGQIGSSIGLALKIHEGVPAILGHDRDAKVARAAESLGAVDAVGALRSLAREASIVFLSLPLDEIEGVLKQIGSRLPEGAIVLDTAPVKRPVMDWFRAWVPEGRYYVGLVPTLATSFLGSTQRGVAGADARLFRRSVMVVVAPPGTPQDVEQVGINVARLLGAKPMLTDPTESDGIMASAHLLPQLAAAALVEASVSTPGWVEGRKLAGGVFAGVTGGMGYYDSPEAIEAGALSSKPSVVHGLELLIAVLNGLRDDIKSGDHAGVRRRLRESLLAREHWLDERGAATWLAEGGDAGELPKLGDQVLQTLFGSRIVDRVKGKRPSGK